MLQTVAKIGWLAAMISMLASPAPLTSSADPPEREIVIEAGENGWIELDTASIHQVIESSQSWTWIPQSEEETARLTVSASEGFQIEQVQFDGIVQTESQNRKHWEASPGKDVRSIKALFAPLSSAKLTEELAGLPVPELAGQIGLTEDEWRQMLLDYQHETPGPWKEYRFQAAKILGAEDFLDEDGFVLNSYFADHSMLAFEQGGGAILHRIWLGAPAAGQISKTMVPEPDGRMRTRAMNLQIASKVMYSTILMPGGNYMTNAYWTLSNGKGAFCACFSKADPDAGQAVEDPEEADNANLRKALYYGFNGPDNRLSSQGFVTQAQQILATNDMVSMAYSGECTSKDAVGGVNWTACMSALWTYISSLPDPAGYKAYICKVPGEGVSFKGERTGFQPLAYGEKEEKGFLRLHKISAVPRVSEAGGSNYSLAGAEYLVKKGSSYDSGTQVGKLTIQADGYSQPIELPAGEYWIAETRAPKGFVLSSTPLKVNVRAGTTADVPTDHLVSEQPKYARQEVVLRKINALTGKKEQSLKDAKFRVSYYALNPASLSETDKAAPVRSWVMQTDDNGEIRMGDSYRVSGEDFYRNERNEPVFPLGIVTFQEIEAPAGYEINPDVFKVPIAPNSQPASQLSVFNVPQVKEQPVRLVLMKMDSGYNRYLPGTKFCLIDSNARKVYYTTDQNGKVTLEFPGPGKYGLFEESAPKGYQINERLVTITVDGNGIRCDVPTAGADVICNGNTLLFLDDPDPNLIRIRKTDPQGNLLNGAQFRLCDNPDLKGGYFLDEDSGTHTISDLKEGTYYLSEQKAPAGYIKPVDANGKPKVYKISLQIDPTTGKYDIKVDDRKIDSTSDGPFVLKMEKGVQVLEMQIENDLEGGTMLPQTGSSMMIVILGLGTALSAASYGLLQSSKKERNRH